MWLNRFALLVNVNSFFAVYFWCIILLLLIYDLWALILVEPQRDSLELDPLGVLHLNNRLFIYFFIYLVANMADNFWLQMLSFE